jgi:class 3 adenylate cyclase
MTSSVDVALLEARLAQVPSGPMSGVLRRRILDGDDAQLFRINPYALAVEEGVAPSTAIEALLRGSALGLFRPDWLLVCRGCGEYASIHQTLRELEQTFHCSACSVDRTLNLDEHVEVAFTVDAAIRPLRYARPEALELEDFFFTYRFSSNILVRGEGDALIDYLRARRQALVRLAAGATHRFDAELAEGWIVGSPRAMITISGERTTELREVQLTFDGTEFVPRPTVAPGPVRLIVHNASAAIVPVLLYHTPITTYFEYRPFLSGQRLLNTEEFRRQLRTEVVRPGTGIAIRDHTLLFTDLRGSTALYDEIGDVAAFELVSAHLESLARVVTRNAGAVVKTIGDAVMASFSRPADAVSAALAMADAIHELEPSGSLLLKIGVHRGPCLAVNLRDSVDYFGQTVNIAARVQAAARGGELCMTAAVFDDPSVRERFGDADEIPSELVSLRGVGEPWLVYRYAPPKTGSR